MKGYPRSSVREMKKIHHGGTLRAPCLFCTLLRGIETPRVKQSERQSRCMPSSYLANLAADRMIVRTIMVLTGCVRCYLGLGRPRKKRFSSALLLPDCSTTASWGDNRHFFRARGTTWSRCPAGRPFPPIRARNSFVYKSRDSSGNNRNDKDVPTYC
jgi:hypothetical protein